MSDHKVLFRKVVNVVRHPNADKLDIVKLDGLSHTIISAIDNFEVGDYAVFFPENVILPKTMVEHFDLSFLKNGLVKTTKIRGVYSQALILPFSEMCSYSENFNNVSKNNYDDKDYDYSEVLGISRPIVQDSSSGKVAGGLPHNLEKYDLENVERYPEMFEDNKRKYVMITEKLEGTNFTVTALKNGNVVYSSRTLSKKDGMYVSIPQEYEIDRLALTLLEFYDAETVDIRGEIIGSKIQGNIYDMNKKIPYVFDVKVNNVYISGFALEMISNLFNFRIVPIISSCLLEDFASSIEILKGKANGHSLVKDKHYPVEGGYTDDKDVLREGIVIKNYYGDRFAFKVRSDEYLASK